MNKLPPSSVRLLTSTQVVSGVCSIAKELVENSIDAQSTIIEVKLVDFGMDKIEVKDNGTGVQSADIPYLAKKHYTSKISDHIDLASLQTLGFRGEALGAITTLCDLEVLTRCADEQVGRLYKFDHKGDVKSSSNLPTGVGTSVIVSKLYKNLPVRRQFYSVTKRKKEELKLTTDMLMALGVMHPRIRFILKHDKAVTWQKSTAPNLSTSLGQVVSPNIRKLLTSYSLTINEIVEVQLFLPDVSSLENTLLYRSTNDRFYISVNGRCVRDKQIEKLLRDYICRAKPNRHPVSCIAITLPPDNVDVNLEPDKTKVLMAPKEAVLVEIEALLNRLYGPLISDNASLSASPSNTSLNDSVSDVSYNYVSPRKSTSSNPKQFIPDDISNKENTLTATLTSECDAQPVTNKMTADLISDTITAKEGCIQTSDGVNHSRVTEDVSESMEIPNPTDMVSNLEVVTADPSSVNHNVSSADVNSFTGSAIPPIESPNLALSSCSSITDVFANSPLLLLSEDDDDEDLPLFAVDEENSSKRTMELSAPDSPIEHNRSELALNDEGIHTEQLPQTETENSHRSSSSGKPTNDNFQELVTSKSNTETTSTCHPSATAQQPQLTQFYSKVDTGPASPKTSEKPDTPSLADDWARGHLSNDEPVVLLTKARMISDSASTSNPSEPQTEPVSMIREETIPNDYRHIVKQPVKKKPRLDNSLQPSIKDAFVGTNLAKPVRKARTNTLNQEITLGHLARAYSDRLGKPIGSGQIDPGDTGSNPSGLSFCGSPKTTTGCIVMAEATLYAFNPYRMKEQMLYEEYMRTHKVLSRNLPVPQTLCPEQLTDGVWDKLIFWGDEIHQAPALLMNGFLLIRAGENYKIVAVPDIPGYHVSDLMDLLEHLDDPQLYRPFKICQQIQSEVVRDIREISTLRPNAMARLIEHQGKFSAMDSSCFHGRPVFTKLLAIPTGKL